MKPAPFAYHAPDSVEAALALLAEIGPDAKPLAGGQSLIPAMNFRLAQPGVLIDLGRAGLDGVTEEDGGLRIGAMVRQSALERHPRLRSLAPLVAEALPFVAHPQIRNRGTVGGSLSHADPAAELPAVMLALEARFHARSVRGDRWIAAADFFLGYFSTALEPDELLTEIEVPAAPPRTGAAFAEISRRPGDFALAGVAATATLDEAGRIGRARIALLSVGPGPVLAEGAATLLVGEAPSPGVIETAARAVDQAIDPGADIHASVEYRRHLARVLTARALAAACDRAAAG